MKLANFTVGNEHHFGSLTTRGVLDFRAASEVLHEEAPPSISEALDDWEVWYGKLRNLEARLLSMENVSGYLRVPSAVKFEPPVRSPDKILCVFVNYVSHGREAGGAPGEPLFFFKHSGCIIGDGEDILVPRFSAKADHEVELGVIIGKKGKDIAVRDAYNYVAGYTVCNDVSFRDGVLRGVDGSALSRNLYKGKVADNSFPVGPVLVARDEIPEPYPLGLTLRVNGELRQSGTTNDMIFRVPELVASASESNTLLPGDIISTGTCSGVGLYTGRYLVDGDIIEAEIERVGKLTNRVRMGAKNPASA